MLYSLGPETEKAGFTNFKFVRNTIKVPRVDDRSFLEMEAQHGVAMDDGEIPE